MVPERRGSDETSAAARVEAAQGGPNRGQRAAAARQLAADAFRCPAARLGGAADEPVEARGWGMGFKGCLDKNTFPQLCSGFACGGSQVLVFPKCSVSTRWKKGAHAAARRGNAEAAMPQQHDAAMPQGGGRVGVCMHLCTQQLTQFIRLIVHRSRRHGTNRCAHCTIQTHCHRGGGALASSIPSCAAVGVGPEAS